MLDDKGKYISPITWKQFFDIPENPFTPMGFVWWFLIPQFFFALPFGFLIPPLVLAPIAIYKTEKNREKRKIIK
jgi:hypothetical protein